MNLRVDLILASEQRSGSLLSLKSLLRIATIVGPLVLILIIGTAVLKTMKLTRKLNDLETQWQCEEPKKKRASELKKEVATNVALKEELEGWSKSHLDWHQQLLGLQRATADDIQLTSLRVSHAIQLVDDEKTPARVFAATMKGTALGEKAELSVRRLERLLAQAPAFSNIMDRVEVSKYGADTRSGASKSDRVFEINCTYETLKFK